MNKKPITPILATLCYVRSRGKTLMLHRIKRPNDIHLGKWNGLGGKFNPGETPEECAIREIKEESGLTVTSPVLKGILTFPGFDGEHDWMVYLFIATKFRGTLQENHEVYLSWIPNHKLLDLPLWEGDRYFMRWMEGKKFFSGKLIYKKGRLKSHNVFFY